jgi:hypothetical protein
MARTHPPTQTRMFRLTLPSAERAGSCLGSSHTKPHSLPLPPHRLARKGGWPLMNSLEWGPCGLAPPSHLDHGSDRLPALIPPDAADSNPDGSAHGTSPGNVTVGYGQGPQRPSFAAVADPNGAVLVASHGKKRRRRAPRVGQLQEREGLLLPSTATAVMTMSPHLVDWYSASLRQGAAYFLQSVRMLASTNALDFQRVAVSRYVLGPTRGGGDVGVA